jgi:uncharacterized protein (DUF1684 family)
MSDLEHQRQHKDEFFRYSQHSPLSEEQRRHFKGLAYYREDPDLRFDVEVKPFEKQEKVRMHTSTGEIEEYSKYGTFQFDTNGTRATLTVFSSGEPGDGFVPFTDSTSGKETYGAGRHVELEWLGGNRFHVDFNQAYNPWCAYSPRYSCPIPPRENRLQVAIRAGEKAYDAS